MGKGAEVNYREWEATVHETITGDVLWRVQAYRLALFAADIGWEDVTILAKDRRTRALSDQLYRALGSLESGRESRDWYYKARHVLDNTVIEHRLSLHTQIIRLLLKMVPDQRKRAIREENIPYEVEAQ
jgi:hypothetical protein